MKDRTFKCESTPSDTLTISDPDIHRRRSRRGRVAEPFAAFITVDACGASRYIALSSRDALRLASSLIKLARKSM